MMTIMKFLSTKERKKEIKRREEKEKQKYKLIREEGERE